MAEQHIFINSAAAAGGDGSELSPYNNLNDIPDSTIESMAAAGDDVYIEIIGTFTGSTFYISADGTPEHPITYRGYNGVEATIAQANNAGIVARNASNFSVEDLILSESSTHGIVIDTLNGTVDKSNISLRRITATENGGSGIQIYGEATSITDVLVADCYTTENTKAGVDITGRINGCVVEDCESYKDSNNAAYWGFIVHGRRDMVDSGWTLHSGTVYKQSWSKDVVDVFAPTGFGYGLLANADGIPSVGEYWYDSDNSILYINVGGVVTNEVTAVIRQWAENVLVRNCVAHETYNPTAGEGHGIGLEFGCKNCRIMGNLSYSNTGSGIVSMVTRDCIIAFNNSFNNGSNGISSQRAENNIIACNTAFNNTNSGVSVFRWNNIYLQDNIVYKNGEYGIKALDGQDPVVINNDYNILSDSGIGNFYTATAGRHSLTISPFTSFDNFKNDLRHIYAGPQLIMGGGDLLSALNYGKI